MALPASLYAVPLPASVPAKKKPVARERKAAAAPERDAELRLKRKIDQADRMLDRLEAANAADAKWIKRLQARKARRTARIDRIETRALAEMSAARLDKVTGLRAHWTAKPNAESVVIDDEAAIPSAYLRETNLTAPDKLAIKAALAADAELVIAGCHLAQSVSLIRK